MADLCGRFARRRIPQKASRVSWHSNSHGIHFVRLMLAGVCDRFPALQIILGHWGDVVVFYVERLKSLARVARLGKSVAEYMKDNLYVTSSGMWNASYMQRAIDVVGSDRILFSADYPYQYRPGGEGVVS
jgi:uncharacterized protein